MMIRIVLVAAIMTASWTKAQPPRLLGTGQGMSPMHTSNNQQQVASRLLAHIQRLEALLMQQQETHLTQDIHMSSGSHGFAKGELTENNGNNKNRERLNNMLLKEEIKNFANSKNNNNNNSDISDYLDADELVADDYPLLADRLERLRELRKSLGQKRNYNLDHLARMNFRRSFRASSALNNRHILGGL